MRCWSVSVGAQEKRENVYSHRRNLRQANKPTMRIEGDEAETWIKRGAISKAAMATMPSKTRRVKKNARKENERANTIQHHHHHHRFGNQLTDSHLNEFQVHVRNRQNGCSCVNHLIHCTVTYGILLLSHSLALLHLLSEYCFTVAVSWLLMIWFVGDEILLNQWCSNVWARSHCPLPLSSISVALGGLLKTTNSIWIDRETEWAAVSVREQRMWEKQSSVARNTLQFQFSTLQIINLQASKTKTYHQFTTHFWWSYTNVWASTAQHSAPSNITAYTPQYSTYMVAHSFNRICTKINVRSWYPWLNVCVGEREMRKETL